MRPGKKGRQRQVQRTWPSSVSESVRDASATSYSNQDNIGKPLDFFSLPSTSSSRLWTAAPTLGLRRIKLGAWPGESRPGLQLQGVLSAVRTLRASNAAVRLSSFSASTGGRAAARPAFTRTATGTGRSSVARNSPPEAMLLARSVVRAPMLVSLGRGTKDSDPHLLVSCNQDHVRADAALGLTSWSLSNSARRQFLPSGETS
mmetsp:Transcript_47132/g.140659  ORF Transcript_47132/g.140659 Transcript_47132/m.140659 type:complete len:203 (+) Transcript_47132:192-800(+)